MKRQWIITLLVLVAAGTLAALLANERRDGESAASRSDEPVQGGLKAASIRAPNPEPADPPLRFPAAKRIAAIGDVHGDLDATRKALRLAGAIDRDDRWSGGDLVLVQTGDQLDRGDDERAILELFERLVEEAEAAGGAFHVLNGNHELMNAQGDLRYVTPRGFADFAVVTGLDTEARGIATLPRSKRHRAAAFRPGGPYARLLARRNTVVVIGESVFVHGGVLPEHVDYGLERINREVRAWLRGERPEPPEQAAGRRGVAWIRDYSDEPDARDCDTLDEALREIGARRIVVAHTVHREGISSACDDKVWRIDAGMAAHYGGHPAALEITGDTLQVITDR